MDVFNFVFRFDGVPDTVGILDRLCMMHNAVGQLLLSVIMGANVGELGSDAGSCRAKVVPSLLLVHHGLCVCNGRISSFGGERFLHLVLFLFLSLVECDLAAG